MKEYKEIVFFRKKLGLTQKEFAKKLGISMEEYKKYCWEESSKIKLKLNEENFVSFNELDSSISYTENNYETTMSQEDSEYNANSTLSSLKYRPKKIILENIVNEKSIEQIARMEGISAVKVRDIKKNAIKNLRLQLGSFPNHKKNSSAKKKI